MNKVACPPFSSPNAEKKVIVPQSNIQYLDWYGTGYIVLDPVTGTGAYMISNELSGGWSGAKLPSSVRDLNALYERSCPLLRDKVLKIAYKHYQKTPYRRGGSDPQVGFDCSGFVYYVYKTAGIDIKRETAQKLYDNSDKTEYPLIGDLVFFGSSPKNIHHVGIIYDKDTIIDAPGRGRFIDIRPFTDWGEPFYFGSYIKPPCE